MPSPKQLLLQVQHKRYVLVGMGLGSRHCYLHTYSCRLLLKNFSVNAGETFSPLIPKNLSNLVPNSRHFVFGDEKIGGKSVLDIAAKIFILQRTFREMADTEGERQRDRKAEKHNNRHKKARATSLEKNTHRFTTLTCSPISELLPPTC